MRTPLPLLVLLVSCRSAALPEAAAAPPPPKSAPAVVARETTPLALPPDARIAPTAAGAHRVAWRSESPIERGKPFAVEVWALEPDEEQLALDVELSIDAAMPEHEHGMVRVPTVEELGPGHWRVEGMYLHMLGRWELYLDLTEGARTERASWELWLE